MSEKSDVPQTPEDNVPLIHGFTLAQLRGQFPEWPDARILELVETFTSHDLHMDALFKKLAGGELIVRADKMKRPAGEILGRCLEFFEKAESDPVTEDVRQSLSETADTLSRALRAIYGIIGERPRVEITCTPGLMSGAPCIDGTRILAETVIVNLQVGESLQRIFDSYPSIPPGGVEAAILWAEKQGIEWRNEVPKVADNVSQDLPE
jgi:uncharacterized protein (DUF433 family)